MITLEQVKGLGSATISFTTDDVGPGSNPYLSEESLAPQCKYQ